MKNLVYGVVILVGLGIIGVVLIGLTMSPDQSAAYDKQRRVEEACDQMMSDAAPGSDKRMTRSICDDMKAKVATEMRNAR